MGSSITVPVVSFEPQREERAYEVYTFDPCRKCICVKYSILETSSQQQRVSYLRSKWGETDRSFDDLLCDLIQKAFNCNHSEIKSRYVTIEGIISGVAVFSNSVNFYGSILSWQKDVLRSALEELCVSEDSMGLQIVLALMCRGANECNARKHASFDMILSHVKLSPSLTLIRESNPFVDGRDPREYVTARNLIYSALVTHIEEHKERAFSSTFMEPSKMYFRSRGLSVNEGDVEVHGANTHLCILKSVLGINLSRTPYPEDFCLRGLVAFLDGGIDAGLEVLWKDENFGKSFEMFPECTTSLLGKTRKIPTGSFIFPGKTPGAIAEAARDHLPRNTANRKKLMPYLQQFCRYFRREFIVPRLINYLLSEEFLGSPLALVYKHLRGRYRSESKGGADDEHIDDVRFWLWNLDSDPPVLHLHRAVELLHELGVVVADDEFLWSDVSRIHAEEGEELRGADGVSSHFDTQPSFPVNASGRPAILISLGHKGLVLRNQDGRVRAGQLVGKGIGEGDGGVTDIWFITALGHGMIHIQTDGLTLSADGADRLTLVRTDFGGESWRDLPLLPGARWSLLTHDSVAAIPHGAVVVYNAERPNQNLRCQPNGAVNLSGNLLKWEYWEVQFLDSAIPLYGHLSQKRALRIYTPAHGGMYVRCLPSGFVRCERRPHRAHGPPARSPPLAKQRPFWPREEEPSGGGGFDWELIELGSFGFILKSLTYPDLNLQCNPILNIVHSSTNRLAWELWRFVHSGRSDGSVFIMNECSTPPKYIQCNPEGQLWMTTERQTWEQWRIEEIN